MQNQQRPQQYNTIAASLEFMHAPIGEEYAVELCIAGASGYSQMWEGFAPHNSVMSGWYSDAKQMAAKAIDLDMGWTDKAGIVKYPKAIYVTMNPVNSALLGRAYNRVKPGAPRCQDKDVSYYHNFFIDVDTDRPTDTSSTEDEKKAAYNIAFRLKNYIKEKLQWPDPMFADSGNGYHLVFKSYFEANEGNKAALKTFIQLLGKYFCGEPFTMDGKPYRIKIDSTVFNPSRLIKLHGTAARKGDPTALRPHRYSFILELPTAEQRRLQGAVSTAMLEKGVEHFIELVGEEDAEKIISADKRQNYSTGSMGAGRKYTGRPGVGDMFSSVDNIKPKMQGGTFDAERYLKDHNIRIKEIKPGPFEGSMLFVLQTCVFDSTHRGGEASIVVQDNGPILYQCFHESCTNDPDRKWKNARQIISGNESLSKWMIGGSFGVVFPHVNGDGKPYARYGNFRALLASYGVKVWLNQMKRMIEAELPEKLWEGEDNKLALTRAFINELCVKHGLPTARTEEWFQMLAAENAFHPVKEWILSKQWDGRDYIRELGNTIKVPEDQEPMWRVYLKKWMIQAVAAVFDSNYAGKGVLTFTGAQNAGKTSWLRKLTPKHMEAFAEGAHVDPSNKDTLLNVLCAWLVELGELDSTFKKADIARLKAFISNKSDRLRPPYGKGPENWKRKTVFAASVDKTDFLVDKAGNTRWWVVKTTAINYQHDVDMQQAWAQAFCLYCCGEQWHLTREETMEQSRINYCYEVSDPVEEGILKYFKFDTLPGTWRNKMTATEVLQLIGIREPNTGHTTKVSPILTRLVGDSQHTSRNGIKGRYYIMPPVRGVFGAGGEEENGGEDECKFKVINGEG